MLSERKPENHSLNRIATVNKENLNDFLDNYGAVLKKYKFGPESIFNFDESTCSSVTSPPKDFVEKRQKTVSQATSSERGSQVTFGAFISVERKTIAPIFVYLLSAMRGKRCPTVQDLLTGKDMVDEGPDGDRFCFLKKAR